MAIVGTFSHFKHNRKYTEMIIVISPYFPRTFSKFFAQRRISETTEFGTQHNAYSFVSIPGAVSVTQPPALLTQPPKNFHFCKFHIKYAEKYVENM